MEFKIIDESNDHKYFTIVPNYILNHSSGIDKGLYLDMKRMAGENGLCFMTEETMCKRNGIGKKQLHKSLKYLLGHKWIKFVGMTANKTRPIKTYKINDIWKLNNDFYNNKKIPSQRAVSKDTVCKEKDTDQKSSMIPPESICIRRTNNKEELIKKELRTVNAKAFGLKSIGEVLKDKVIVKKSGGASYEWQDAAVQGWKAIGLKGTPSKGWFREYKFYRELMERAVSFSCDANGKDPEKLTYWKLNQLRKAKNEKV